MCAELSVLEGDDRVDFVDMVRAVPEDPAEVVDIRGVVHLDLVAESSVLGKGIHLSFLIHYLGGIQSTNTRSQYYTPR